MRTELNTVYKNPLPQKALELVELSFYTKQEWMPYRGSGTGVSATLKIIPREGKLVQDGKIPGPIEIRFLYMLLQNEFVYTDGDTLDPYYGNDARSILSEYWNRYLSEVKDSNEMELVKEVIEKGEELPRDYKPVDSLKIFLETLLDNIDELICAILYVYVGRETKGDILEVEKSFDNIDKWIAEVFTKRDKLLNIKINDTPIEVSKAILKASIKSIYEKKASI